MTLLVMLLVAATVVVLVMRATGPIAGGRPARPPRPPRRRPSGRPVAPDDDPEFLRELSRRTRPEEPGA